MRRIILSFSLVFCLFTASAQSDEINISAAFAQSIELRVIGDGNVNFVFNTLASYQIGQGGVASFEVASSTSFSVEVAFTPLTNAKGDQVDLDNLTFHLGVDDAKAAEEGVRWNFTDPDYEVISLSNYILEGKRFEGFWIASESNTTIITPGPSGNAGSFEDNTFHLRFHLGNPTHFSYYGKPILLDQNIQPGTYTGTMTLTAIPSVT